MAKVAEWQVALFARKADAYWKWKRIYVPMGAHQLARNGTHERWMAERRLRRNEMRRLRDRDYIGTATMTTHFESGLTKGMNCDFVIALDAGVTTCLQIDAGRSFRARSGYRGSPPVSAAIRCHPERDFFPSNSNRNGAAVGNAPILAYKRAHLKTPRWVKMTDDPLKSVSVAVGRACDNAAVIPVGAGRTKGPYESAVVSSQTKDIKADRFLNRCLSVQPRLNSTKSSLRTR